MALKRIRKLIHETMVEEPTKDLDVPSKVIREEERKDYDNYDDHENEEEQPTIVLFISK
jgi:hypothetical protein